MNLKKEGFQLPEMIRFDEETLSTTYGKVVVEPLERGFGTTIGNSLRRILLSSLKGAAVTAVKIDGALHEFTSINGVKEDIIDIVLNLKNLRLKFHGEEDQTIATFNVEGPAEVKGSDLQCDSSLEVLNPDITIATLDKNANFSAEVYVGKGRGYLTSELQNKEDLSVGMVAVDAVFTPIKKVNFWVEKARVGRATDYDKLIMELWTDGSINPKEALSNAAKIIRGHLKLFVSEDEYEEVKKHEAASIALGKDGSSSNVNLFKSVDELELSVRSYNCLKNADIKTIAELVQKTEPEMLKTKNFGRKSLDEIKEILGRMGLYLGMKIDFDSLSKEALQSGGNR